MLKFRGQKCTCHRMAHFWNSCLNRRTILVKIWRDSNIIYEQLSSQRLGFITPIKIELGVKPMSFYLGEARAILPTKCYHHCRLIRVAYSVRELLLSNTLLLFILKCYIFLRISFKFVKKIFVFIMGVVWNKTCTFRPLSDSYLIVLI